MTGAVQARPPLPLVLLANCTRARRPSPPALEERGLASACAHAHDVAPRSRSRRAIAASLADNIDALELLTDALELRSVVRKALQRRL